MPVGDFLILMFLQWTFIGRGTDAERVIGVLHGQVELCRNHRHTSNINGIEWAKYGNENSKRLICMYQKNTNFTCFPDCQNMYLQNMSLILHNLSAKDEGFYEETVLFENGTKTFLNITLSLLFASKIVVSSSNGTLTLTCEVRGEFMVLRWLRDGLPLPVDQRFSFSELNETIKVSNLTSVDCATYTCQVSDQSGTSHEAHIIINDDIIGVCRNKSVFIILIFVGLALFVLSFVFICVLCIYKYGYCKMNPSDRSTRDANRQKPDINMEEPIYNEPNFFQVAPTQSVNFLPYVYSSFVKPTAPHQTDQAEDFGYSTIAEVHENTQPPQTT